MVGVLAATVFQAPHAWPFACVGRFAQDDFVDAPPVDHGRANDVANQAIPPVRRPLHRPLDKFRGRAVGGVVLVVRDHGHIERRNRRHLAFDCRTDCRLGAMVAAILRPHHIGFVPPIVKIQRPAVGCYPRVVPNLVVRPIGGCGAE